MRKVREERLPLATRGCRKPGKTPKNGNTERFYSVYLLKRFKRGSGQNISRAVVIISSTVCLPGTHVWDSPVSCFDVR